MTKSRTKWSRRVEDGKSFHLGGKIGFYRGRDVNDEEISKRGGYEK